MSVIILDDIINRSDHQALNFSTAHDYLLIKKEQIVKKCNYMSQILWSDEAHYYINTGICLPDNVNHYTPVWAGNVTNENEANELHVNCLYDYCVHALISCGENYRIVCVQNGIKWSAKLTELKKVQ